MGIFNNLFGGRSASETRADENVVASLVEDVTSPEASIAKPAVTSSARRVAPVDFGEEAAAVEKNVANEVVVTESVVQDAEPTPTPAPVATVNIWDLEDDVPPTEALDTQAPEPKVEISEPVASETVAPTRRRRNKTRLLGFEKSDGQVVDLFNDSAPTTPSTGIRFPVGWIVVVEGPGRGAFFSLQAGMSQIGRGEDQTIQLDFGDTTISRVNHAAIVYDPETSQVLLGHGGKSNLVRLNGSPLISNETLKDGDEIRMGETTLRFSAFCSEEFNWNQTGEEESDDVEIA